MVHRPANHFVAEAAPAINRAGFAHNVNLSRGNMTSKIPKWKVTLYWISPVNNAEHETGSVRSAWTPGGAVVQALQKYQFDKRGRLLAARASVYLIEVEPCP